MIAADVRTDPAQLQRIEKDLTSLYRKVDQLFADLLATPAGASNRKLVADVRTAWATLQEAEKKIVEFGLNNHFGRALRLNSETLTPLAEELDDRTEKLTKQSSALATSYLEDAQAT